MLEINTKIVEKILVEFLKDEIKKFGINKAILGLSGGVDSTVSAFLLRRAFNPDDILFLIMPYKTSSKENIDDARKIAESLGVEYKIIDITQQIDSYFDRYPTESSLIKGNKMARERMSILFDFSQRIGAMVVGTSNKTELLLGYGTWYGDMASSVNPLGDLYKTQVFMLAEHLGVPEKIIKKIPSADLWPGQSDEEEMGIKYRIADEILYLLIDKRLSVEKIEAMGYMRDTIFKIKELVKKYQFKRELPVIPKLSYRTIGKDFLYPRDWGV